MTGINLLCLLLGGACLVGVTFVPAWLARALGALFSGLLLLAILRFALSLPLALVLACITSALAYRFAPLLVLRRVTFLLPALLLLVFATTLLMFEAPGNPFASERQVSPAVEQALRVRYGVPRSGSEFFLVYMRRLLIDGTLGPSLKVQGRSVEDLLAPALPVSFSLGLLALLLALALGLALGFRAGLKPNALWDHVSMGVSLLGVSLPNFVIGTLLCIVFALRLGWFPVAGWGSYQHLLLPAVTLALPTAAVIARLARSGMLEVMQQDYVRAARAKGMPESRVIGRHALKGAILPVVSYLGPAGAAVMTGSFVVEVLFNVPGMGQWFVKGAINRDYSVVLGTAIVYFALITLFNLLVDLAYAWLDPRVRERT
ncbi:MAG: ABC transporter permease [Myxococcota bacterium]